MEPESQSFNAKFQKVNNFSLKFSEFYFISEVTMKEGKLKKNSKSWSKEWRIELVIDDWIDDLIRLVKGKFVFIILLLTYSKLVYLSKKKDKRTRLLTDNQIDLPISYQDFQHLTLKYGFHNKSFSILVFSM